MNNKKLWKTVLAELELELPTTHFKSFFPQTKIVRNDQNLIEISCPKAYIKARIEKDYQKQLKAILDKITQKDNQLKFSVEPRKAKKEPRLPGPLFQKSKRERGIGLSPQFSFDNFVVGRNNNLAHAVAQAVVERPGVAYNPFFLYSGVGLGKTHLMQAIGNTILERHEDLTVLYCTGETFTNELIDSIQSGSRKKTAQFRDKFRSVDVLLIDDVQFIAGREGTQEELFHTFNALHMAKKQIVLTSDKPPKEIAKLEERLSSRFAGGIIADMQTPDIDMRTAILRKKAQSLNVAVPDEVTDAIAQKVSSNIRELEGYFHKVLIQAQTENKPLTKELVIEVLGADFASAKTEITPNQIIKTVSAYFALKPKDLRGKRRLKEIVLPRQIAMFLMRSTLKTPYMEIGEILGGRDHTTIMHGEQKIAKLLEENTKIREQVSALRTQIGTT
jgi:chromosomal replication initiator protein